jgi:RHS repeat-associated protein
MHRYQSSSPSWAVLACRGSEYRDGFNGQERDQELNNIYSFEARLYDARVGRWTAVDPLSGKFVSQSPYNINFNNPLSFVDHNGELPWPIKGTHIYFSHTVVRAEDNFLVKTGPGNYQLASNHFVNNIPSIGHIAQTYEFAYVSVYDNPPKNNDQKTAESNGLLVETNSEFFKSRTVGTSPHIGVDFKAAIGTDVYSMGDGLVTDAGYTNGTGNYVVIKYGNGDHVRFMHLDKSLVKKGDLIAEGDIFAKSGNTGYMKPGVHYPPHLHIDAADKSGMMVDPLQRTYGTMTADEFWGGGKQECNEVSPICPSETPTTTCIPD